MILDTSASLEPTLVSLSVTERSKTMGRLRFSESNDLREILKKLRREKLRRKNKRGGGGSAMTKKTQLFPQKVIFFSNYIGPF